MATDRERRRFEVIGTVQGVGFRPFVYRTARELGLVGFVQNTAQGVTIEAEGMTEALERLAELLERDPPPLARVLAVNVQRLGASATAGTGAGASVERGFEIRQSTIGDRPSAAVSVDSATCGACVAELFDPADRRYRYPFINCTDCGPRYTIVRAIPYDRASTTMAGFTMCAACQDEYDDPGSRRFHAQPNACPTCGPRLAVTDLGVELGAEIAERAERAETECIGEAALVATIEALGSGRIVAVKGLGGYHLAVDATDEAAVKRLRQRKARDDKPFAVMVADLAAAHALVELDDEATVAISSPRRPIVLAPRRFDTAVVTSVAPGLRELGVMLAYTPLHHLLMAGVGRPLVMTSGNISDDPIAYLDDDARSRLAPLADLLCSHNRAIHIRCDDSVVRSSPRSLQVLRRSRGYAPEPMRLPHRAARQVLALGAELKSTIAVAKDDVVVASHHIGDLEHLAAYTAFRQAINHLASLYGVVPEVVAHDLHPEYLSTKAAGELGLETLAVQHHHAHVASLLVEHGRVSPVIGIAFDGLGYGPDGTLWGGELLLADLAGYQRLGHLGVVAMPGGAAAIREPWRMTAAHLAAALGDELACSIVATIDARAEAVVALARSRGCPMTSSAGRLFDAVAALLGCRARITYEGQAAIELEMLASSVAPNVAPSYRCSLIEAPDGLVIDPTPMLAELVAELRAERPRELLAAGFHAGLAHGAAGAAARLAASCGVDTVALSGGVFQNQRLADLVAADCEAAGLLVLRHHLVPPNDGGISIGQAAIAAAASTTVSSPP